MIAAVRAFDAFMQDNGSYAGTVEADGVRAFQKIDAYDRMLTFASPDPATKR